MDRYGNGSYLNKFAIEEGGRYVGGREGGREGGRRDGGWEGGDGGRGPYP